MKIITDEINSIKKYNENYNYITSVLDKKS
jgi:hypothetical protein